MNCLSSGIDQRHSGDPSCPCIPTPRYVYWPVSDITDDVPSSISMIPILTFFAIVYSGFGTGTNGAYLEQIDRITKWDGDRQGRREMVINMEFGAFDNERTILPFTKYDTILDNMSLV